MRVNSLTLSASSNVFLITNRLKLLRSVSAIEVKLAEAELRDQERLLIRDVESALELISSLNQRLSLLESMITLQEGFAAFWKNGSKMVRHLRSI